MNTKSDISYQPDLQDLEAAVLGAALIEAPALRTLLDKVGTCPDVFHQASHRHIFQAICALHHTGLDVDMITVVNKLQQMGKLEAAGGMAGVSNLTLKINSAAHIESHCMYLLQEYTRRKLLIAMQKSLQQACDKQADVLDIVANLQQTVNSLHSTLQMKRPRYVGQFIDAELQAIIKATQMPQGITGVPSGLTALDKVTGGWQNSDLIILAARPGMGKTSFLASVGVYAARVGKPGAIFTLEVSSRQFVLKMIAKETGYTTSQLKRGVLPAGIDEAYAVAEKAESLRTLGILLDDSAELNISALRAKASQLKAEEGIAWLAIDYLQLLQGDRVDGRNVNREQEISSISRGLKRLAKELDIPIIALAQLSREVEKRTGKRPQLSDLRESGALEQDADVVIFLYRPEYYQIMQDEAGNSTIDTTELIIAKHRNGGTAEVVVRSLMKCGHYEDLHTPDWASYQSDKALAGAPY